MTPEELEKKVMSWEFFLENISDNNMINDEVKNDLLWAISYLRYILGETWFIDALQKAKDKNSNKKPDEESYKDSFDSFLLSNLHTHRNNYREFLCFVSYLLVCKGQKNFEHFLNNVLKKQLEFTSFASSLQILELASKFIHFGFEVEFEPDIPSSDNKGDLRVFNGQGSFIIEMTVKKMKEPKRRLNNIELEEFETKAMKSKFHKKNTQMKTANEPIIIWVLNASNLFYFTKFANSTSKYKLKKSFISNSMRSLPLNSNIAGLVTSCGYKYKTEDSISFERIRDKGSWLVKRPIDSDGYEEILFIEKNKFPNVSNLLRKIYEQDENEFLSWLKEQRNNYDVEVVLK